MTITRLLLVRHAATTAREEGRFSGSTGVELSDQGRWQAARLGERLSKQRVTREAGSGGADSALSTVDRFDASR